MPLAPERERFHTIDGLRGVAALAVVVFHATSILQGSPHAIKLWKPADLLLNSGHLGVEIFFVLSGFVMAYSLRDAAVTPRFLGRFALRRSIRLDPCYWVMLWLTVAHRLLSHRPMETGSQEGGDVAITLPHVLANMFYLQDLLGVGNIITVAWTLCMEVQFYLFFALMLGLVQKLTPRIPPYGRAFMTLFSLPGLVTIGLLLAPPINPHGLFIFFWHMFYLGVLTFWTHRQRISPVWLIGYSALLLVCMLVHPNPELAMALVTAGFIYTAGRLQKLAVWLAQKPLLFLGRISYSLYISHCIVVGPFIDRATRRTAAGPLAWWAILAASTLGSIALAYVVYVVLEKPTLTLAQRLKEKHPTRPSPEPITVSAAQPATAPAFR